VTGAGSGIGKATAQLFAKEGAKVGLLGAKEELEKTLLKSGRSRASAASGC